MSHYNLVNFAASTVGTDMDAVVTDMVTILNGGDNIATPESLALICLSRGLYDMQQGELVEITQRGDGAGGGNQDRFTVTRNFNGDRIASEMVWTAGSLILCNIFAEHFDEQNALTRIVAMSYGGASRIICRADSSDSFEVVELPTPAMGVRVGEGYGFINDGAVTNSVLDDSLTFVAPSGDPRIDLVYFSSAGIAVKTGSEAGSPVAPTADSDEIPLATIYLTVGMIIIEDADITDLRSTYYG